MSKYASEVPLKLASLFALAFICRAQNPHANDPQAAESGRLVFRIYCTPCHGIHAEGGRGPDLTRGVYAAGPADADLFRTIHDGVPGTEMPSSPDFGDDTIWRLVSYIRSATKRETGSISGNSAAGEKVFWGKGGCGNCHKVGSKGGTLGPDLSRSGRQRSSTYLREAVVNPDADISPGYETIEVVMQDGRKITGVQRGFDNFSAQLSDMTGKFYSFEKRDVTSIKREFRSLMPGNYKTKLTPEELNDVLAYLSSLKGAQ